MAHMGVGAQLAIGKESAWGTPVADTALINFESEGLKPELNKGEEPSLLASKAPAAFDLMGHKVSGPFSATLKPELAGFLIKAALGGTDTVTQNFGGVTGQHQHSIVAQTATGALPSYTLYANRKQATKRYSGCKINTLRISAKSGDYVRVSGEWKGKDESSGSITSTTPPSKKAYKLIGGTVTLGGTALDVTSVELEIQNNLEDGPQTNVSGLYHTEPVHGKRRFVLSIEMPYDTNSESLRNTNFLTETVLASAVLHLESPEIIAVASKYRMDITLNNVAILDADAPIGGPGLVTMTIRGEATAVGATEPITAVIYDNVNTAY